MKHILVPTDFSSNSDNAIDYILDFIIKTQLPAKVYLLNAYMVESDDVENVIHLNDQIKAQSIFKLVNRKKRLLAKYSCPGIEVEMVSRMGSIQNLIPRIIKEFNIDLLVMGEDDGKKINQIAKSLKKNKSSCPLLTVYHYENQIEEIS